MSASAEKDFATYTDNFKAANATVTAAGKKPIKAQPEVVAEKQRDVKAVLLAIYRAEVRLEEARAGVREAEAELVTLRKERDDFVTANGKRK